jgi:hypothetical protein
VIERFESPEVWHLPLEVGDEIVVAVREEPFNGIVKGYNQRGETGFFPVYKVRETHRSAEFKWFI